SRRPFPFVRSGMAKTVGRPDIEGPRLATISFRTRSLPGRSQMTRSRASGALSIVVLWLFPAILRGQDSQYWTVQYGPVAELLGGVVVGTTRDLSATYYNPGALALAKDPSLLASVNSFEYTKITATTVAPVLDFQDSSVRPSPSLFAFALPRSWTGSHTLAFSSLTRQDFDLRIDNWQVTPSHQAGGGAP